MSDKFPTDCRYCHAPILMVNTSAGWKPYEKDEKMFHNCRQPTKTPSPEPRTLEDFVRAIVREELVKMKA